MTKRFGVAVKTFQADQSLTLFGKVGDALRSPLMRNGYSLIVNTVLTSMLGLLFWIFAARLYSAEQVGLGTALLSLLFTIGNISQLAVGNMLNRFLPVAENKSARLIMASAAAASMVALVLAFGFVVFLKALTPSLSAIVNGTWGIGLFVASTVAWTLFSLQDSIFAGMRTSSWIPLKNTLFGFAKFLLLAPFAEKILFEPGIFAAWIVPLPVFIAIFAVVIFRELRPTIYSETQPKHSITFRACVRFFGWEYIGILALVVASSIAAFMVLDVAGAEAAATYNLTYAISFSLYLVGRSMSVALLSETAVDKERIHALSADALLHTFLVLIPALLFVFAAAPLVMSFFGPYYVEHAVGLLRLLILMCLPWSAITIYLATARINNELKTIAVVQTLTAILALGFGVPLVHKMNAFGMGLAWLLAQSSVALGILLYLLFRSGFGGVVEMSLHLAGALARLKSTVGWSQKRLRSASVDEASLKELLSKASWTHKGSLHASNAILSHSDVLTTVIVDEIGNPKLVYKAATTESGRGSLARSVEQIARVRRQTELQDHGTKIPEVLAFENTAKRAHSIERYIDGRDGRNLILRTDKRDAAMAAALRAFSNLRRPTERFGKTNDAWLSHWIELPVAALEASTSVLMKKAKRHEAIKVFVDLLLQYWKNRSSRLGLGHGDFSANNLIYAAGFDHSARDEKVFRDPESGAVQVSAILDWESATHDAPSGIDACLLLITTRALVRDQELGSVVRGLLLDPQWTLEELAWLRAAELNGAWLTDATAMRAMIGLAWLNHIAANLKKSEFYSSSKLWTASNIDRVLEVFLKHLRAS